MCRLSWNLGASTSWNPQGLSRPVMGLLYFDQMANLQIFANHFGQKECQMLQHYSPYELCDPQWLFKQPINVTALYFSLDHSILSCNVPFWSSDRTSKQDECCSLCDHRFEPAFIGKTKFAVGPKSGTKKDHNTQTRIAYNTLKRPKRAHLFSFTCFPFLFDSMVQHLIR